MRLPWTRRSLPRQKHGKQTICNNCRDPIGPDIHLVTTKRGLLGSPGRCHKILGPFRKGIIIGNIYDNYDTEPRPEKPLSQDKPDPYERIEEGLQEIEAA